MSAETLRKQVESAVESVDVAVDALRRLRADDAALTEVAADTKGILAVLHNVHWRHTGSADRALMPNACPLCRHQAARVAEYLAGERA